MLFSSYMVLQTRACILLNASETVYTLSYLKQLTLSISYDFSKIKRI